MLPKMERWWYWSCYQTPDLLRYCTTILHYVEESNAAGTALVLYATLSYVQSAELLLQQVSYWW